jgi:hypothetical protein
MTAEHERLAEDGRRTRNWKRWGPYLAERQWATVREDYSPNGDVWGYFPHDHARSRAYRWGEDGLLGICDRECRLCFAYALWNGKDPILKERLFGLTGPQGNHGEDVKESYFYLDATPTYSYTKSLYKYPQTAFPYSRLVEESARCGRLEPEVEIEHLGTWDEDRYFDVLAEYAKAGADDILIRLTVSNRGPEDAPLHVLPTIWFRNTWAWGREGDGYFARPTLRALDARSVLGAHDSLGDFRFMIDAPAPLLFTENESNLALLFPGATNGTKYTKDAFHEHVVGGRADAVNPAREGTKAAAHYQLTVPAGGSMTLRFRLFRDDDEYVARAPFGKAFDETFERCLREADEFYENRLATIAGDERRNVARQAYAGLLFSKQFYHYIVEDWLDGDPAQPAPPDARRRGRNRDWTHLYNRDVISVPDKWEYPWYAAWDLAFHMIPFADVDPAFAKEQLLLFLREWYLHPNGQMPAYEFAFSDTNPPVHAWAVWRVYKISGQRGQRDRLFLERAFQKLLLNFTWWVNRKDDTGNHIFSGGFLGLDNIGIFDRSMRLPDGSRLEQADGTAWMAFYCGTMLAIAIELARESPAYEDLASKFFEHFVAIVDAMNNLGGSGLWHEDDGFYYDTLHGERDRPIPLRLRSLVGVIPLFAVEILEPEVIDSLPGFSKRMRWFLENRSDLARHITYLECSENCEGAAHLLLAVPSRERLERVLRYVLDENEFLSPYGVRSLSRVHKDKPFALDCHGAHHRVTYVPGDSDTGLFGGNSNWRGPIWFPLNYLLIEALERYDRFYGDGFKVECPTGSGNLMTLREVAAELNRRLAGIFLRDAEGRRPCDGGDPRFATDPHWRDLVLFYEYFHAETGRGLGASHQTGWTALVARCLTER